MKRIAPLVAAAAAAALAVSASASSGTARPQTFTASFLTVAGHDQPVYVSARGPISGLATATQTERPARGGGQLNVATLHFARGTISLTAPEQFGWAVSPRTCTGRAHGSGTWRITGGTGAYARATGNGTFTATGFALAQRTAKGTCRGAQTPPAEAVFQVTLTFRGTIALAR